jgi:phosphoribosylformylglycinamidine cyclo-ligase
MPAGRGIRFRAGSWAEPPLFDRIRRAGEVAEPEMRRTFNLGVGLMVVASPGEVDGVIAAAEGAGVAGWRIGEVVRAGGSERVSFIER